MICFDSIQEQEYDIGREKFFETECSAVRKIAERGFNMMLHKKIDTHVHYLPPAYNAMLDRRNMKTLDGGFPRPNWNVEMQLEGMEQLGTSYALLSISSPPVHLGDAVEAIETARGCNEFGAELKKKYPDKFGVMASLPLPEVEASVEEVKFCHDVLNVNGFALQTNAGGVYIGDPMLDPVMEELDKIGAVVSIHPTMPGAIPDGIHKGIPYPFMEFFFDTTRTVANMIAYGVVKRYPNIKFVIPHAGAFMPILSDRLATLPNLIPSMEGIDVMENLASFYYDLAGLSMPKQYDVLRKVVDDSHLLYGSDTPFTPMPMCLKMAEAMDQKLGEDMMQKVYVDNPRELFHM